MALQPCSATGFHVPSSRGAHRVAGSSVSGTAMNRNGNGTAMNTRSNGSGTTMNTQNGHTQNGGSLATAPSPPPAAATEPLVAVGRSWVQKELTYYDNVADSSSSYHPRKAGKGNSVKVLHLELAAAEFSRRFAPISMEQDMKQEEDSDDEQGAPVLLVSTHVKPDWTPPNKFTSKVDGAGKHVKFLLIPNVDDEGRTSSLFISCMPGSTHGEADAHVLVGWLKNWHTASTRLWRLCALVVAIATSVLGFESELFIKFMCCFLWCHF